MCTKAIVGASQRSSFESVTVCFQRVYFYVYLLFMSSDDSFACRAVTPKLLLKIVSELNMLSK